MSGGDIQIFFLAVHAFLSFIGATLLLGSGFTIPSWKEVTWAELIAIVLLGPGFVALYSCYALVSVLIAGGLWLFERLDEPILKDKR